MGTGIAYVDETWNPEVGCTKCSPGCLNCFAEELHNMRHRAYLAGKKLPKQYAKPFSEIQLFSERLEIPLHWRQPRRILVPSMGDLFHKDVPFEFIKSVLGIIALCPQHTFLLLTKRPEKMAELSGAYPDNITGMVTAENQAMADLRTPLLLQCGFKTTGLSIEPMLGEIDLKWHLAYPSQKCSAHIRGEILNGPNWVVVGCESGPKRRPCKLEWIESIVEQCKAAGVGCFVKQIEINGKVEHAIEKFPKDLQIREVL